MMRYRTCVFAAAAAAVGWLIGAGVLVAQPMPAGTGGTGGTTLSGPQQEVKTLQAQLAEEQSILKDIEGDLREDFESKPEWSETEAAHEQAQAEHEAARSK